MALQQSIIVDHNFFAAWHLCEKKKKKIRRGGLDFKAT
jgi:hypothetical protein